MWRWLTILLLLGVGQQLQQFGNAQTRVDAGNQIKNADFSRAASTKPFKVGTTLPASCSLGEAFLKSDETPGNNLYLCIITGLWSRVTSADGLLPAAGGIVGLLTSNGSGLSWQAPGGDLTGAVEGLTVRGLQGRPVSSGAPADGMVLMWSATEEQWRPEIPAGGGNLSWASLLNPGGALSLTMDANPTTFTYNASTGTIDGLKLMDSPGNTGTGVLGRFATAAGSSMIPWQADSNGIGWRVAPDGSLQTVGQTAAGSIVALRGIGTAQLGVQGTTGEWDITVPANFTSWTFTAPVAPCGPHQWWTTDSNGVGSCSQPSSSDLGDSSALARLDSLNIYTSPQTAGAGLSTGSDCISVHRYVDAGITPSIRAGEILVASGNIGANGFPAVVRAGTGGGPAYGVAKLVGAQTGAAGTLIDVCQSGSAQVLFRAAPGAGNIAVTPNNTAGLAEDSGKTAPDLISAMVGRLGEIGAPVTSCDSLPCLVNVNLDGVGLVGMSAAASGGVAKTQNIFDGSTTTLADGQSISWSCGSGNAATCTTTWRVPSGVTWVDVQMWGAGAGGAGSSVNSNSGPGGGGGGYFHGQCGVTPGANVTVTVGAGGAGSASASMKASDGGPSIFPGCATVLGGLGGSQPLQSTWGGRLSGTSRAGWQATTSLLIDKTVNYPNSNVAGASAIRADGGGNGAGAPLANNAGNNGGDAPYGGGGGASGGYLNVNGGTGGVSGAGGNGGNGGGCSGTSCTACTVGAVPGGGGGSPGSQGAGGANQTGCSGARGEVRVAW